MKLVVHELKAVAISQVVTPTKNTVVEVIRPHIYRHNLPSGSLKVQIYNGVTLVAESATVTISSIGSLSYYHGYVEFDISAYLAKNVAYTINLVSTGGYSFSEAAYCGWVNGLDLAKYPIKPGSLNTFNYPLDYEIWERTVK